MAGVCGFRTPPSPTTIYTLTGQNYLGKVNSADGSVETYTSINGSDNNFKSLACGGSELYGITGGENPRIVKIVETGEDSGIYETMTIVSIPKVEQNRIYQPQLGEGLLPHAAAVDPMQQRFMYITNIDDTTIRLWRVDLLGQAPFERFELTGGRRTIEGRIEDLAFTSDGTLYGITNDRALYDIDKNRPLKPTARPPVSLFTALRNFPYSEAMAISGDEGLYILSSETSPFQIAGASISNILLDPNTALDPELVEIGPEMEGEINSATICNDGTSGPDYQEIAPTRCANFIECKDGEEVGSEPERSCRDACLARTATIRGEFVPENESNCCVGNDACARFTGKVCADQGQKSCYAVNLGLDQLGASPSTLDISSFACTDANIGEVVNGCIGERACNRVGSKVDPTFVGGVGIIRNSCVGNGSCQLMASNNERGQYCPVIDEVISSCNVERGCSFLAYGGNNKEYTGSVRRITHSCNAYNACENALQEPDLDVPNVNINELNGACNRPFSCISYSRNQDLICQCPDIHWQNDHYISEGWDPPCQAYGSPRQGPIRMILV